MRAGRYAWPQAWDEARHGALVGEIGLAELRGEEGFFGEYEAQEKDGEQRDGDCCAGRGHEPGDGYDQQPDADIEWIAHVAVGAGGSNFCGFHFRMNDCCDAEPGSARDAKSRGQSGDCDGYPCSDDDAGSRGDVEAA